jgi:hypothetical protein
VVLWFCGTDMKDKCFTVSSNVVNGLVLVSVYGKFSVSICLFIYLIYH